MRKLVFALLVLFAALAFGQDEEQVKARPVYAELQTIVSMALDECYTVDNSSGDRAEGTLNGHLACMIELLSQVKRDGVGAFRKTPKEDDLAKDEMGNPIRPRRQ